MRRLVEGWAQAGEVSEDIGADIGDDALAEPVHAIEAGGACQGEDEADAEQGCEIFVDQARLDPAEADIDHAPHGKRHGEGCRGRDDEGGERRRDHAPVAQDIGFER